MKKPIVIFLIVLLLVLALFYLTDADVFEVKKQVNNHDIYLNYSISELFLTNEYNTITLKGWFILLISLIGFPFLVAWRSTLKKFNRKTGKTQSSFWDKI